MLRVYISGLYSAKSNLYVILLEITFFTYPYSTFQISYYFCLFMCVLLYFSYIPGKVLDHVSRIDNSLRGKRRKAKKTHLGRIFPLQSRSSSIVVLHRVLNFRHVYFNPILCLCLHSWPYLSMQRRYYKLF